MLMNMPVSATRNTSTRGIVYNSTQKSNFFTKKTHLHLILPPFESIFLSFKGISTACVYCEQ